MSSKIKIIEKYWQAFDNYDFDKVSSLMLPKAIVYWPNTREIFKSRNKFILTQKNYPGRWRITIEKIISTNDNIIVSVVKVWSEENTQSFYVTSFFRFDGEDFISEITEYWGDVIEAPEWRIKAGYSEIY